MSVVTSSPNDVWTSLRVLQWTQGKFAERGIETREVSLTKHDVYVADECFLTGTAAEVVPVVKVDNRVIGSGAPGPVTRDLKERFHALARK